MLPPETASLRVKIRSVDFILKVVAATEGVRPESDLVRSTLRKNLSGCLEWRPKKGGAWGRPSRCRIAFI